MTRTNGLVVCWGYNDSGSLGSSDPGNHPSPTVVPNVTGAVMVAAGGSTTCALKSDKSVMCWGGNYFGQLGTGTLGYARRPKELDHILEDGFDPMEIP